MKKSTSGIQIHTYFKVHVGKNLNTCYESLLSI